MRELIYNVKAISGLAVASAIAIFASAAPAFAQQQQLPVPTLFSIRSGETLTLRNFVWLGTGTCDSRFLSFEKFDVLEGPPELSLQFQQGQVHASSGGRDCPKPVKGGTILLTAKDVTEKKEANLTFRVHIQAKDGQRQTTLRYKVLLYPAAEPAQSKQ